MLAGTIHRKSGLGTNRIGAKTVIANRIVVDELEACHAVIESQIIHVDQNGTLPTVTPCSASSPAASATQGTTCFTSLATALDRVRNQAGGTVIQLAAGSYTLPDIELQVEDLTIQGDTCPVVGLAYIEGARRNSLAENFIPDHQLDVQGSGLTSLNINGQTIEVSMGANDPDFSQCADLVGHSVLVHSIPGGTGTGVLTTHTITAVTATSITISGVMPLSNPLTNGEGFVILPNVTLQAVDGTQVKDVEKMTFSGVVFDVSGALYVHSDSQKYFNTVVSTDSTLFVAGSQVVGTANTVVGFLVSAHGSQQDWSLGAVLGQEANILADSSIFNWQFGVGAGAELAFHAQNGATASVFGSDFFLNDVGASATGGSTISFPNSWADGNDVGYLADLNSTLSAQGIPSILGFVTIPASVTNNGIGIQARYGSYIWNAGTTAGAGFINAALDLPQISGNTTTDVDLDDGALQPTIPIAGNGHEWGDISPTTGAGTSTSGFSHVYAP